MTLDLKYMPYGLLLCLMVSVLHAEQLNSRGQSLSPEQQTLMPFGLLHIDETVKSIFWFSLQDGQLMTLKRKNNTFETQSIYRVSIGKRGFDKLKEGDKKTPIGIYRFVSFIKDEKLVDFYGVGAFPVNYPNAYDKYRQRTGSGIWMHGMPKTIKQRPLRDSDGCMVLNNDDLKTIINSMNTKQTLVILNENFEWDIHHKNNQLRDEILSAIKRWRLDWVSRDTTEYLTHYSRTFNNFKKNYQQWAQHKHRVNRYKTEIRVEVSKMNIVLYPGTDDVIQVEFFQKYYSSNFKGSSNKRQLWKKQGEHWKIIYEDEM